MKKLVVLIAVLTAALFIAGCTTPPPAPSGPSAAELLASAKDKAPSGALVGQATAKGSAEQTAMRQILRALIYISGEMIDEQSAMGRLSATIASDLKQSVSTILSRSPLSSAVKVESGMGAGDMGYAVFSMSKADAQTELTKAVNLAKEQVSAPNFDFRNFDAKFTAAAARDWKN
jgi:PBP1b-binding outer membrane lipoprotein LpoB